MLNSKVFSLAIELKGKNADVDIKNPLPLLVIVKGGFIAFPLPSFLITAPAVLVTELILKVLPVTTVLLEFTHNTGDPA